MKIVKGVREYCPGFKLVRRDIGVITEQDCGLISRLQLQLMDHLNSCLVGMERGENRERAGDQKRFPRAILSER